jgi:hypothetical protein
MVGSVLMERMREERDFDAIDPVFFTTSNIGGAGPAIGKPVAPLKDANDVAELAKLDVLVSSQGGDYTKLVYPKLRAAGWAGYWIDAASALIGIGRRQVYRHCLPIAAPRSSSEMMSIELSVFSCTFRYDLMPCSHNRGSRAKARLSRTLSEDNAPCPTQPAGGRCCMGVSWIHVVRLL